MAVIDKITLKDSNNQDVVYDIGASGTNVKYDNSTDIKTKIDGKIDALGGSLANTIAGSVTSQVSSSNIVSGDNAATIWGKINALRAEYGDHLDDLINTETGVHGIRYYNNQLQYNNNGTWTTIETGGGSSNLEISGGVINRQYNYFDPVIPDGIFFRNVKSMSFNQNTKQLEIEAKGHSIIDRKGTYHTGSTAIQFEDAFKIEDKYVQQGEEYVSVVSLTATSSMVPWTTGSASEISKILEGYYNGTVTLELIKSFWAIGDSRPVTLKEINASELGIYHHQQNVELVIIDFNHDTLEYSGIRNKALITVQIKNLLVDENTDIDTGYNTNNTEKEHYNNDYKHSSGYQNMNNWSDSILQALGFSFFQNDASRRFNGLSGTIRPVVKETYQQGFYDNTIEKRSTNEFGFVCSVTEIFGSDIEIDNVYGKDEGYQYEYFKTATNRLKKPIESAGTLTGRYWTRTIDTKIGSGASNIISISSSGNPTDSSSSTGSELSTVITFCM